MAMTTTVVGRTADGRHITRHVETGAANSALNATIAPGLAFRLLSTHCAYSAAPAQAGVATKLDCGAGASFDSTLNTGSANAQFTNYVPSEKPIFGDDDAVLVAAPAGGVGITASVVIYTEDLKKK